jgi:hypothetical protein
LIDGLFNVQWQIVHACSGQNPNNDKYNRKLGPVIGVVDDEGLGIWKSHALANEGLMDRNRNLEFQ